MTLKFKSQTLILKSELEINELKEKRKQLTGAKEISLNRRREGKNKD